MFWITVPWLFCRRNLYRAKVHEFKGHGHNFPWTFALDPFISQLIAPKFVTSYSLGNKFCECLDFLLDQNTLHQRWMLHHSIFLSSRFQGRIPLLLSCMPFLTLIRMGGCFPPPRGFSCRVFKRHHLCPRNSSDFY